MYEAEEGEYSNTLLTTTTSYTSFDLDAHWLRMIVDHLPNLVELDLAGCESVDHSSLIALSSRSTRSNSSRQDIHSSTMDVKSGIHPQGETRSVSQSVIQGTTRSERLTTRPPHMSSTTKGGRLHALPTWREEEQGAKLKVLDLSYCPNVTSDGLVCFLSSTYCSALKRLDLSGVYAAKDAKVVDHIMRLDELTALRLEGLKMSEEQKGLLRSRGLLTFGRETRQDRSGSGA